MIDAYAAMLPELHAERQLARIEAAIVPHLKPGDAEATVRKYRAGRARTTTSGGGLAAALGVMPIQVVVTEKGKAD